MRYTAYIGWLGMAAALFAAGCDKQEQSAEVHPQQVELLVRASQAGGSRTAPGEVGDGAPNSSQPIEWTTDDAFALWAIDGATDRLQLDGAKFELRNYGPTFNEADFLTTADEMPEGTYTYYAFYPFDALREGSELTGTSPQFCFEVPAEQRGDYDPSAAIMVAQTTGRELPIARAYGDSFLADGVDAPQIAFKPLTHLLRLRIVTSGFEQPIARIDILFPEGTAVTGTARYNPIDATISPEEESNRITLLLDEPIAAGSDRYLWVHLLPCELPAASQIRFRAYDTNGIPSELMRANLIQEGRTFAAAHISPVSLHPVMLAPTAITFSCPDTDEHPNFLGETPTKLYISEWPEEPSARPVEAEEGLPYELQLDETGKGTLHFYFDEEAPAVNLDLQGTIKIGGYESSHALLDNISYTIAFNKQLSDEAYYAVPYLFFEDFNTSYADNENYAALTTSGQGNNHTKAIDLGARANLPGWSAACWKTESGAISVSSYRSSWGSSTHRAGRVDSPPLPIVGNTTATVSYRFGGSSTNNQGTCIFGTSTNPDPINGSYNGNTAQPDQTAPNGSYNVGSNGSFTNFPETKIHTLGDCSTITRLSWCCNKSNGGVLADSAYIFIDDVKVSIGSEVKHPDLDYRSFFPIE